MKRDFYLFIACLLMGMSSCTNKVYPTNGETIYKTGKNVNGIKALDKSASRITIVGSCQTCHGKSGDRMKKTSIRFRDLADPGKQKVPYTDSLLLRFLDKDLKSDGSKADIGVIWKLNDKDKKDLLTYLKGL